MAATLSKASPAASSMVAAQQLEIQRAQAAIEAGVAAADDQADAGKDLLRAAGQPAGVDVGLQVVDGHQRDVAGPRTGSWPPPGPPAASRPAPACWPRPRRRDRRATVRPAAAPRRSPAGSAPGGPARRSPAPRRRSAGAGRPARRPPNRAPPAVGDDGRRGLVAGGFQGQEVHGLVLGLGS